MDTVPRSISQIVNRCLSAANSERLASVSEIGFAIEGASSEAVGARARANYFVLWLIAALVAILAMGTTVGVLLRKSAAPHSLAILPAKIEGDLGSKEYLAQGVIRGLTDRLGSSSDVKVRSEYIVDGYRGSTDAPDRIGKALNVDAVILGVFSQRNSVLSLRVSLIRVADGKTLRSDEYNVDEDTDRLSRSISSSMLEYLNIESESMRQGMLRGDTANPEARKYYTLGRLLIGRKAGNDVQDAIVAFTNATQLDPAYAKAWAGLADSYLATSIPGVANALSPSDAGAKAKRLAETARGLDPELCEVYNTLGQIALRIDWDWNVAEANFRKAIELNPEFPAARTGLIATLNVRSRFDEALLVANELKQIDTSAIADLEIAKIQYRKHDFESMRVSIEKLIEQYPFNDRLPYIRSYEMLATGKFNEAIKLLEPKYSSGGENEKVLISAPLGFAYARTGQRSRALDLIEFLDGVKRRNWVPSQERAVIFIGLKDYDRALTNLQSSCEEKFQSLPPLLTDPLIDEIKSDPRFAKITECVGLP